MEFTPKTPDEPDNLNLARQLEAVIEAISDATWYVTFSANGARVLYNRQWYSMLGYQRGEIEESIDGWIGLVHPEDLPKVQADMAAHMEGRAECFRNEHRLRTHDGTWLWVLDRGRILARDPQGRPLVAAGSQMDITAQKEAEQSLVIKMAELQDARLELAFKAEKLSLANEELGAKVVESDGRFRAYIEQSSDALVVHDFSGHILDINPQACSTLGYTREELLLLNILDVETGFELPKAQSFWGQVGPGVSITLTGHYRRKDGSIFPVETRLGCFDHQGSRSYLAHARDISERWASEKALHQREAALIDAQRLAKVGSWERDLTRNVTYWSAEMYRFYERDQNMPPPGFEEASRFYIPESWERLKEAYESTLATGEPYQEDVQLSRLDEKGHRWATVRGEAIRDPEGTIVGIRGTLQDITERKRTEEALIESERFNRATLDALTVHLAVLDAQGIILATNQTWHQFALQNGTPWEGVSEGINYLEVCDRSAAAGDPDAAIAARGIRSVLEREQEVWFYEYPCHSPKEERWFLCRAMPFPGEGPLRVVVVHEDVTSIRKAEQALATLNRDLELQIQVRTQELNQTNELLSAREEEIRSLVDHLFDCVITIDSKGIVRSANLAVTRILGYQADELIGRNVAVIMPDPPRSEHDAYLERYLRTGEARTIGIGREVQGLHKDGHLIPLELAVTEFVVHGETFFIGTLRDIRERKQFISQLMEAREEADQANQAKSAFLAAMSHEIRTPMNGVIGMIDVLHQTSLKGHQVEMVNLIHESAYSLLGIIDDILDFSKIEAGKLELDHAPILVEDILEKTCGMMDRLAEKKAVELTHFMDPAIPKVLLGDELRLRQVLVNLINNAIKFSSVSERPGRVALRASLVGQSPGKATLLFQVMDNGIGMDGAAQARLFTPFAQADISTTRRFGGTGLGLAISGQLVSLMGGHIEVESAPDLGSTFSVQLPFESLAADAGSIEPESPVAGLACMVVGGSETQAADLALYLESAGAKVERAISMEGAWEMLPSAGPGLWVWVIDERGNELSLEQQSTRKFENQEQDHRFVVIRWDHHPRRRRPRLEGPGRVGINGSLLTRRTLLEGVAIAAGRKPAVDESTEPYRLERSIGAPSHQEARLQGRLILLAEDNETNQQVILKQLDLLGYAADVASDGSQALERWNSGDYALLLTDLHMPKMDGYELTTAIREQEHGTIRFPIIVLTANALKGEAERCRAAGMDAYLTKPVSLVDLQATLERWLPASSSAPDIPSQPREGGTPSMDVRVLKALVGNDPAIIKDFYQSFRTGAAQTVIEIRTAFERREAEKVGALAHKLKSSARSVGALGLGDLCEEIEQAGRAGDVDGLTQLRLRFDMEWAAVEAFLQVYLDAGIPLEGGGP